MRVIRCRSTAHHAQEREYDILTTQVAGISTTGAIVDFLGIGVPELILILMLALIVAGPKRMLAWSYQLGKWVAALRQMWSQTASMLQKEFDEAGVDVQVPRDIPTRADIRREVTRVVDKYGAPIQEPIQDLRRDIKESIEEVNKPIDKPSWAQLGPAPAAPKAITPPTPPNRLAEMGRAGAAASPPSIQAAQPAPPAANGESDLGTWSKSSPDQPASDSAPKPSSFGTWSANG